MQYNDNTNVGRITARKKKFPNDLEKKAIKMHSIKSSNNNNNYNVNMNNNSSNMNMNNNNNNKQPKHWNICKIMRISKKKKEKKNWL